MKIKLILIGEELFNSIRDKTASLSQALIKGETEKTDLITEEIFLLTGKEPSVSIEEAKWVHILCEIRKTYRDYKADFILEEEDLIRLSEVKMDYSFDDFLEVVKMAVERNRRILQIPYEEEDGNV